MIFEHPEFKEHEEVVFCRDPASGLSAIIGIHNTVLGPALGGTRMWNYASEAEALTDVLRLSYGMTLKAAISGMQLGGGKAVIIGDAQALKNKPLLKKFGEFIQSLGGKYVTAEDVNMTAPDMEIIRGETSFVCGLPESMGGSGDPSPSTAHGVYMGMKACAKKAWGTDRLSGKVVLVQGVGQVGTHLVDYLFKEGAKIAISDVAPQRLQSVAEKYKAEVVEPEKLYDYDMDIYSPCALGATINDETVDRLKCSVVAGAANNQLANDDIHGARLLQRGIYYAPDFLVNAGGLIKVGSEYLGIYSATEIAAQTENIYNTVWSILDKASQSNESPQKVAKDLALQRIYDQNTSSAKELEPSV